MIFTNFRDDEHHLIAQYCQSLNGDKSQHAVSMPVLMENTDQHLDAFYVSSGVLVVLGSKPYSSSSVCKQGHHVNGQYSLVSEKCFLILIILNA